eukprot:CAMPEP_0177649410 /NCGR_PEP_ID=MMETSP0447-20121125/11369_1 /TAXON_ID=0 /ORGANISM="Stygamoeba regulata, Strain BSH-02190019" /LENGTH=467 /DNA_ID=CAMNT_0019152161 /DNA_START=276 /DNA_END=1679 /DNA_ORIENTATION=+
MSVSTVSSSQRGTVPTHPHQQRAHFQPLSTQPSPQQMKLQQPQQQQSQQQQKQTPSQQQARADEKPAPARLTHAQMVQNYRRATCAFMQDVGRKLRLPQLTISTAIVFFHRFFRMHNYEDYDRYLVSLTALFLAGKVEETPKKLQHIIEGTYPHIPKNKGRPPLSVSSPEYQRLREDVLNCERVLLRTIGFDLTVDHPYCHLLNYVKSLEGSQKLAQTAWNFVNDSLRTTLCLEYPAQHIACASLYLACRYIKVQLPDGKDGKPPWWAVFDCDLPVIKEISNIILDLYDITPSGKKTNTNGSAATSTSGKPAGGTAPSSSTQGATGATANGSAAASFSKPSSVNNSQPSTAARARPPLPLKRLPLPMTVKQHSTTSTASTSASSSSTQRTHHHQSSSSRDFETSSSHRHPDEARRSHSDRSRSSSTDRRSSHHESGGRSASSHRDSDYRRNDRYHSNDAHAKRPRNE